VKTTGIAIVTIVTIGLVLGSGDVYARGAVEGPIIYVESQGELPPRGPFQQLYPCDLGLCTEFGPGDPGHRGGRWWIDENGNGEMDDGDVYFSCPLLGLSFAIFLDSASNADGS
jgi:hypothetical protein